MPRDCIAVAPPRTDMELSAGAERVRRSRLKRLIDIFGALLGLLFLGPFLLLVGVLIRLETRGPALFRQARTGLDGVPFAIYKFRSMVVQEDGPEVRQAVRNDDRTTRLGAFLRQSSIDELPQLLNVLKGEMSLVGPRPHAVAHDRHYAALVCDYDQRFLTRPGITGLAQVSGYRGEIPNVECMAGRVRCDLIYIRTWSLAQDIRIMTQTFLNGPFDPAAY